MGGKLNVMKLNLLNLQMNHMNLEMNPRNPKLLEGYFDYPGAL